jgi:tetratricopeptide (TPR) repeat protein
MIPKRRLITLGSIVVAVILASAAFAIYISQQQNKSSSDGTNGSNSSQNGDGSSSLPEKSPAEKEADAADKKAYEGDVQAGVKQLDNAIENTSDKSDLYIFYSRKATLLLNNNMLADALEVAKKAYELRLSSDSAALVGQIAAQQGNKAVAIDYYKKAIERIDKNDPFADEDKTYYQGLVTELGGTL